MRSGCAKGCCFDGGADCVRDMLGGIMSGAEPFRGGSGGGAGRTFAGFTSMGASLGGFGGGDGGGFGERKCVDDETTGSGAKVVDGGGF